MAQARCGGRQRLSRLALVALLVVPLPAWPAAFVVTKTADTNDGLCDADCSLREAVLAANASPGADGIEIPAGLYVLTRSGALEDAADTGDLDLTGPTTLTGAGAALSIVDGAGSDRLIDVINADVAVTGLTLRNGSALGDSGGAIAVAGGALTLDGVALEDSFADLFGGGVAAEAAGLTVVNSTLSGNTAASFGGGLYHKGFTRPLELRSSTLSGNGAARGGGIFVDLECGYLPGECKILSSTVAENSATLGAGGIEVISASPVQIANTIVSGNVPTGCLATGLSSLGHNLDDDGSCPFGASGDLSAPAGLGPLGANGGPTRTHPLQPSSPAIDSGDEALCPPTDQRGLPRVDGDGDSLVRCDRGAFEFGAGPTMPVPLLPHPVLFGALLLALAIGGVRIAGRVGGRG